MKNFIWALAIVVILGGGYLLWQGNAQNEGVAATPSPSPTPIVSPEPTPTPAPAPRGAPMTAAVTYSGTSFSPSEVTIKKGGTVTWQSVSGGQMWVASAQHPSHMIYGGTTRQEHCPDASRTAFDQCAGGGEYSFTFQKVGTWNYHDHMNATVFGKVTVME
ncbi:hypothetical protein HY417_03120 [Candidatus Kaiserbacteria bacterium]|nr:hypothetical protein [Candidatus Kaiserbacteria bacterium]